MASPSNRPPAVPRRLLLIGGGAVLVASGGFFALSTWLGPAPANGGRRAYPLPDEVLRAPREVREAYEYALERPDVLQWMPCPCGCVYDGHQNNRDCFVRSIGADGSVTLDPHGLA